MNKKQATRHSLTHASCVAVSSGALFLLCSPLLPFSSRPLMNMRHHFPKKARLPVDPFFRFFHHPSSLSLPLPLPPVPPVALYRKSCDCPCSPSLFSSSLNRLSMPSPLFKASLGSSLRIACPSESNPWSSLVTPSVTLETSLSYPSIPGRYLPSSLEVVSLAVPSGQTMYAQYAVYGDLDGITMESGNNMKRKEQCEIRF